MRHRTTGDLDLFSLDDDAYALTRANGDTVIVDIVREHGHQKHPDKLERDGIRVDPPDEILANKLATLVGRMEERDLIDVMFLEREGHRVEDGLPDALRKDGGCTPATLAWVLSQITIADDVTLPAGVRAAELRSYVDQLVRRLRRAAAPPV